ncbi:hypothetical protein, partial [Acinetobacter baumannii]|uniref:hypothetical protein n=1 Tax=Acinetobacter baumannii TaxID=470 RepID=UPI0004618A6F
IGDDIQADVFYASIHDRYIYQILILVNNSSHAIQSIRTMFSYVTFRQRWSGFGLIFSSSS